MTPLRPVSRFRCCAAVIALCVALSGCGSISEAISERAADAPAIGLPQTAPARPQSQMAYPAVHDMPPARPAVLMSENEQMRIEKDLAAARARHQAVNHEAKPDEPEPKARKKPDAGAR